MPYAQRPPHLEDASHPPAKKSERRLQRLCSPPATLCLPPHYSESHLNRVRTAFRAQPNAKRNILVDAVDGELPGLGDEGVEASAIVSGRARDVADDMPGHGRVVKVIPPVRGEADIQRISFQPGRCHLKDTPRNPSSTPFLAFPPSGAAKSATYVAGGTWHTPSPPSARMIFFHPHGRMRAAFHCTPVFSCFSPSCALECCKPSETHWLK